MARKAAVAGTFYAGNPERLANDVEWCFLNGLGPGSLPKTAPERRGNVVGLVCPHAGFQYSGSTAAFAYTTLAEDGAPDVAVILGPNHYGHGAPVAVSTEEEWETPLGIVRLDKDAADAIVSGCRYAAADDSPHSSEHSVEVQLPFIQYTCGEHTRIVPIAISNLEPDDAMELATELGKTLASTLEGRSAVVIASTDFSHYVPHQVATDTDEMAIREILLRDPKSLIMTVHTNRISMCGAIGTAVMLEACGRMGATKARKLAYHTSGDVTGNYSEVVGYAAISIEK